MSVRGLNFALSLLAALVATAAQPVSAQSREEREAQEAVRKAQDAKNAMRAARLSFAIREAIQQAATAAENGALDTTAALKVIADDAQSLKIAAPFLLDEIEAAFIKGCLDPEEKCFAHKSLGENDAKDPQVLPPPVARGYAMLALTHAALKSKEDAAIFVPALKEAIAAKPQVATILIRLSNFPAFVVRGEAVQVLARVVRRADLLPIAKEIVSAHAAAGGAFNLIQVLRAHGQIGDYELAKGLWYETDAIRKKIASEGFMAEEQKAKAVKNLDALIDGQLAWILDDNQEQRGEFKVECQTTEKVEGSVNIACKRPFVSISQRHIGRPKIYRIASPMDVDTERMLRDWRGHESPTHHYAYISDRSNNNQAVTDLDEVCRSLGAKTAVGVQSVAPEVRNYRESNVGLLAYRSQQRVVPQSGWYMSEIFEKDRKGGQRLANMISSIECSNVEPVGKPSQEPRRNKSLWEKIFG